MSGTPRRTVGHGGEMKNPSTALRVTRPTPAMKSPRHFAPGAPDRDSIGFIFLQSPLLRGDLGVCYLKHTANLVHPSTALRMTGKPVSGASRAVHWARGTDTPPKALREVGTAGTDYKGAE